MAKEAEDMSMKVMAVMDKAPFHTAGIFEWIVEQANRTLQEQSAEVAEWLI